MTSAAEKAKNPDLARHCEAVAAADRVLHQAKAGVRRRVGEAGLDAVQHAAHGFAWLATTVEALRQMTGWAQRLSEMGGFGEVERSILDIAFAEYLAQIAGGIPMSQSEVVRLGGKHLDAEGYDLLARDGRRWLNEEASMMLNK